MKPVIGTPSALAGAALFLAAIWRLNEKNHSDKNDYILEYALKNAHRDNGKMQVDVVEVSVYRYGGINAADLQELLDTAELLKGHLTAKSGEINVTF